MTLPINVSAKAPRNAAAAQGDLPTVCLRPARRRRRAGSWRWRLCTTCTPTAQPENQAPGAVEPNDKLSQSMVVQKTN
jgi:hypothetical protein